MPFKNAEDRNRWRREHRRRKRDSVGSLMVRSRHVSPPASAIEPRQALAVAPDSPVVNPGPGFIERGQTMSRAEYLAMLKGLPLAQRVQMILPEERFLFNRELAARGLTFDDAVRLDSEHRSRVQGEESVDTAIPLDAWLALGGIAVVLGLILFSKLKKWFSAAVAAPEQAAESVVRRWPEWLPKARTV